MCPCGSPTAGQRRCAARPGSMAVWGGRTGPSPCRCKDGWAGGVERGVAARNAHQRAGWLHRAAAQSSKETRGASAEQPSSPAAKRRQKIHRRTCSTWSQTLSTAGKTKGRGWSIGGAAGGAGETQLAASDFIRQTWIQITAGPQRHNNTRTGCLCWQERGENGEAEGALSAAAPTLTMLPSPS